MYKKEHHAQILMQSVMVSILLPITYNQGIQKLIHNGFDWPPFTKHACKKYKMDGKSTKLHLYPDLHTFHPQYLIYFWSLNFHNLKYLPKNICIVETKLFSKILRHS